MKLITDLQKEESMTREEANDILPILQAFAEGKEIEVDASKVKSHYGMMTMI